MLYQREIDRIFETDVLVAGGGMAGFGAAVAAARSGVRVLLVDRNAMLGGMATAGLVGPFMTCYNDDGTEQIVKGIFDELCRRTEARGGAIHPSKVEGLTSYSSYFIHSHRHVTPFLSEVLAVVMEEMAQEAGVELLYNVQLCDCEVKEGQISSVIVAMKEGLAAIHAKTFIDCTGDADLAYMAGLPTVLGDAQTGDMQPCSLFFEVGNIDREAFIGELERRKAAGLMGTPAKNCWSWLVEEGKRTGEWTIARDEIGNYEQNSPGRFKINCTRMAGINSTDTRQVTQAMIDGRRQVQQIADFMRRHVPGCKDMQVLQVASALGVRESRHIVGEYCLTVEDIMSRKHFDDAICTFGYAVDVHNSTGGGVHFQCVNDYYTIPYRCLVPVNCDNVLAAGRCISGTSGAAASYRVMPACVATGEAAGLAAAMALKDSVSPRNIDIQKLRAQLIKNGAVIKD